MREDRDPKVTHADSQWRPYTLVIRSEEIPGGRAWEGGWAMIAEIWAQRPVKSLLLGEDDRLIDAHKSRYTSVNSPQRALIRVPHEVCVL